MRIHSQHLPAALGLATLLTAQAAAARAPVPWVELRIEGLSETQAAGIRSEIRAQLIDLAQTEPSEPNAQPRPACVVLIDAGVLGLVLRFTDDAGRLLAPTRVIAGDPDELTASEVGSIVRAFLIAQSESDRAVPAAEAAHESPAPRAPAIAAPHDSLTPPERSREASDPSEWRGWFTAEYSGTNYAPELRWQSGLAFELAVALSGWLHGGLRYGFYPAADVGNALAVVSVTRHDAGAWLGVGKRWHAVAGAVELGGGVSDTLRSTEVRAQRLVPRDDSALLNGSAWLRLRARVHLPGFTRLAIDVAPAVELVPGVHPLVIREQAESRLLTPNLVRLRCDLGISLDWL